MRIRNAGCCLLVLATLVSPLSPALGDEPDAPFGLELSPSPSPERWLVQSMFDVQKGRLDDALAKISTLVRLQPDFALAQLVYGDVMKALTGRLPGFGAGAPGEMIRGLRDEARARVSRYVEGPPPETLPSHFLEVPPSVGAVVLVDLEHFRLYLFQHGDGQLVLREDFYVSIGKGGIDKQREGDEKTPIGIYTVSSYLSGSGLPDLYGAGAFPISYPNGWDRLRARTGSGIWIHGTESALYSRPPLSSRGCVTMSNSDFLTLKQWVEVEKTPVVLSRSIDWVSPGELEERQALIQRALSEWRSDWESLDTERYLSHYAESFRSEFMDRAGFAAHKRRLNAAKTFVRVRLDDVAMYGYPGEPELVLVEFLQRYDSSDFRSVARKRQYWRREEGRWQIVFESKA